ncbi:MAG: hypothetical protein IJO94_08615 [Firmicutes bacterium]|nr:hypothetical protein [Bacillota bacterium]
MKKKLLIALSYVLILALGIVGTMAYLTDKDEVNNTFLLSENIDINLDEEQVVKKDDDYVGTGVREENGNTYPEVYPGAVMPKDPTITVLPGEDVYVRAKVTIPNGANWLNLLADEYDDAFRVLVVDTIGEGWSIVDTEVKGDDVTIVLLQEKRLAKDDKSVIFTTVEIPGWFEWNHMQEVGGTNMSFDMDVIAEAIQAAGMSSAKVAFARNDGDTVAKDAASLADALDAAKEGDKIVLEDADFGTVPVDASLKGVTIDANGANARFNIQPTASLTDVTFTDLDVTFTDSSSAYVDGGVINIDAGATVKNLVIEDVTINGGGGRSSIVGNSEPSAEITIKNSELIGTKYVVYGSAPAAGVTLEGNTVKNIESWVIMENAGDAVGAKLTINGNTFDNCTGGIAKYLGSTQPAGATTVFTNNTLTNCTGHDGNDAKWFTIPADAATILVDNNTLDGAAFVPGVAQGLGK